MKKRYIFKTSDEKYRNISSLKEYETYGALYQGYWQDKYKIYVYIKHEKNPFYKFINPCQYAIKTRKMLIMNNIYAHILFKKDLI